MERLLKDKIALVTGASRGIGKEIVKSLASEGAFIFAAARNKELLDEVVADAKEAGGDAIAVCVDMASEDSIKSLVETVKSQFGRLDILVNNAGVVHSDLLKDTDTDAWDRCMQVNARGPFILCRECLGLLQESQRGFVVNVGSVVSVKGYPKQCAYTASKHALRGMTMSLAEELRGSSVSAHIVCPGGVATDMVSNVRPDINKDELIEPREIADIVHYIVTKGGKGIIDEFHIRRQTSSPWFS